MMLRFLPFAASLVARSLRIRLNDTIPNNAVIAFWHGKMFAGWYLASRRGARPVALVSPSKDGNILTSVLHRWGYEVERGSSSKSGLEALERAIARVRAGECDRVVITPDGPRGPIHRLKRGAFLAAQELDLPVYFLTIRYHKAKTLGRSWDRFEIPLPFSKVSVNVKELDMKDYPSEIADQHDWMNRKAAELQL
jgi:lysophospholipid acyltransferase (LPLAT)-like uncharacterized protein